MVELNGQTAAQKAGTLLKLKRGAKAWSAGEAKPKAVRLHDGVLTYADVNNRHPTSLELWQVAQLKPSTVAGAPAGAFEMQVKGKPPRTYTFAAEPGSSSQEWLRILASAVPDNAVDSELREAFRSTELVMQLAESAQQPGVKSKRGIFWHSSPSFGRDKTKTASADEDISSRSSSIKSTDPTGEDVSGNAKQPAAPAPANDATPSRDAKHQAAPVPAHDAALARAVAKKEEVELRKFIPDAAAGMWSMFWAFHCCSAPGSHGCLTVKLRGPAKLNSPRFPQVALHEPRARTICLTPTCSGTAWSARSSRGSTR